MPAYAGFRPQKISMPFQTKLSVLAEQPLKSGLQVFRAVVGKLVELPPDPRQQLAENIFNVHVQFDFHPRLGTVGDLGQHKIAPAFHDTQHFRACFAPVIGMLHALQTYGAIERPVAMSRV